jgi:hypothetical protein
MPTVYPLFVVLSLLVAEKCCGSQYCRRLQIWLIGAKMAVPGFWVLFVFGVKMAFLLHAGCRFEFLSML